MKPCEPFLLFQTGELYGNADTAIAEHEQPCHELTFVVSGCGTSFADGVPTDIAAGDCYFSFEGERHKIVSDAKNPLRYKFLGFRALDGATEKLLQNFEEFRDGRKRLAHVPELDGLFMALFEELERESIFSDKMIGSIISEHGDHVVAPNAVRCKIAVQNRADERKYACVSDHSLYRPSLAAH